MVILKINSKIKCTIDKTFLGHWSARKDQEDNFGSNSCAFAGAFYRKMISTNKKKQS